MMPPVADVYGRSSSRRSIFRRSSIESTPTSLAIFSISCSTAKYASGAPNPR
jgi:hypothetical protein